MLDTQLLKFLENKPADESYVYQTSSCCAAAQFNESIGREYTYYRSLAWCGEGSPTTFDGKLEKVAQAQPHTFGAMLDRARREFADA